MVQNKPAPKINHDNLFDMNDSPHQSNTYNQPPPSHPSPNQTNNQYNFFDAKSAMINNNNNSSKPKFKIQFGNKKKPHQTEQLNISDMKDPFNLNMPKKK